MQAETSPIGKSISEYSVLGKEQDVEKHTIGVDVIANLNDMSRWVISIVTKQAFINQEMREIYLATDDPATYFSAMENVQPKPPYVINDLDITDEVLRRKFKGRIVEQDLAEAMELFSDDDSDDS